MRIVIDMQGAQTESRFRGIGRYTLAFAQAVVRNRGEHEIILVLSGLFPETIEPIRAAFEGLLPQENIRVWYAPGPVKEEQAGNEARREVAELLREAFIAGLQPDLLHITSLFEGYVDDAVTSIGHFEQNIPVSVTMYDLIPLLNPDKYLTPNPRYHSYYQRKIESLNKAQILLAISEYARQEAVTALKAGSSKITTISTAIEDIFVPREIQESGKNALQRKLSINHPFILYTGGADERKNLPRLIRAYAALDKTVRQQHQLVFAGRMPEGDIENFKTIASKSGLKEQELIFTGYISDDELVALYNLCKLYVFPSWHEGFGLPALEAMACGAPVIGANTTSLPEVIGLDEALFDPFDEASITNKILEVLQDNKFRQSLIEHGLKQAKLFSWDTTARIAISTWERLDKEYTKQNVTENIDNTKPRLAFVSPLPPERTGIADYSAELLPELAQYYDIILVVDQQTVAHQQINKNNFTIRDVAWLRNNFKKIDRVLYQVGNSPFHKYMLPLIKEIPGTIVLHDFYNSGLMSWLEQQDSTSNSWSIELYQSHGYKALNDKYVDAEEAKRKYPVNWHLLQHAQGVIVHSSYSKELAKYWFEENTADSWQVIPLLRSSNVVTVKEAARKALEIDESDFVVCSFGFLDFTKLNHRLIKAWLRSSLSRSQHCRLVFVGENHGGKFGADLLGTINNSHAKDRISITGFVSHEKYHQFQTSADLAVQLRTLSRGESSAAVLDCMNHGLPVIVNANGSMAELDKRAVWLMPDEFTDEELTEALEALWHDAERRKLMGEAASSIIRELHSPEECALQYVEAIEHFNQKAQVNLPNLFNQVAQSIESNINEKELINISDAIAKNHPEPRAAKQLLLDITETSGNNLKTGIERVANSLTIELINNPPKGYRIEPVYLSNRNGKWRYVYARQYTSSLLDIPDVFLEDEVAYIDNGDVILGLDISGASIIESVNSGYIDELRAAGVTVYFMVHDIIPIRMPDVFPPGANEKHTEWLNAISAMDGVITVTRHVKEDFESWLNETEKHSVPKKHFMLDYSHHGADFIKSLSNEITLTENDRILNKIQKHPSFLMVGTIEPRKGYLYTLKAFEKLWLDGVNVNLVIVGKEGWLGLPDDMRRDIPETMHRLKTHDENGKRLFLLEGISDEFLNSVYAKSSCLIAASYDEGFGLPLIEAAQHKLPIIARDIPVFREVAGDHAFYFDGKEPEDLSEAIQEWLTLYKNNSHPRSDDMPWLTWKESAKNLMDIVLGKNS